MDAKIKDKNRKIDSMIFLSQGNKSEKYAKRLHKHMDDALHKLSRLQQPGEHSLEAMDVDLSKVEGIAKDIFVALTGREVVQTEQAEYTGTNCWDEFLKK